MAKIKKKVVTLVALTKEKQPKTNTHTYTTKHPCFEQRSVYDYSTF